MTFTKETVAELEKPLPWDMISERSQAGQKLSYIEGWYALAEANAIFGFDGWSCEVVSVAVLRSEAGGDRGNYTHVVRVHVRVRAGGVVRDGIGVGVGSLKDPAAAIELAEKAAETDAQKRALKSFGNRFGLALYDKEREGVGASREAQRLIDEVSKVEDVDAWVKANAKCVAGFNPADQEVVRIAAKRRRDALAPAAAQPSRTAEAPTPPQTQAHAHTPNPAVGALLKSIGEAKGPKALADIAPMIMSTGLNGSAEAVHGAYAARWVKCIDSRTDETSFREAVGRFDGIDETYRKAHLGTVEAAIKASEVRLGVDLSAPVQERQPGDEG